MAQQETIGDLIKRKLAERNKESALTDEKVEQAILNAYRRFGRVRIPLPALVSYAMRELGTSMDDHLNHFMFIHGFIRKNWGNNGLFSRRRGVKGGIKVRDHVKL